MKAWAQEKQKSIALLVSLYGKVVCCVVVVILLIFCLVFLFTISSPKKLRVSFLDIGQGDAILIQTPSGHDMLIDGGPNDRVLEKLSEKMNYFDKHIDVVVSTHGDADHITGLISVLQKYTVDKIVVSPLASHTGIFDELEKYINNEHAEVHIGIQGDEIIFGDGVIAHILYPRPNSKFGKQETNDASVSMVVTYKDESVVLTGDLPSTHEDELIGNALPQKVTIYKAGHHGSKYSSGDQLLSYIHPEYAVISAGKDNKYGHPNQEAVSRLQRYSQEILSTIERGTITFLLDGRTVAVKTTR